MRALLCIPGGGTIIKNVSDTLAQGDKLFFKDRWWVCLSVKQEGQTLRVNVKESK